LGLIDFMIWPHLAAGGQPGNPLPEAEQRAAGIPNLAYTMDDQTAITVVDGEVRFVSEGQWTPLRTLSPEPDLAWLPPLATAQPAWWLVCQARATSSFSTAGSTSSRRLM